MGVFYGHKTSKSSCPLVCWQYVANIKLKIIYTQRKLLKTQIDIGNYINLQESNLTNIWQLKNTIYIQFYMERNMTNISLVFFKNSAV